MTRNGWIAVGGLSALSIALAIGLAISVASGDSNEEPAGFAPPGADQLGGPMEAPFGAPVGGGPPEELQECLAEEGVELPVPGQAVSKRDQEELQDAFEACADVLPQGGPAPPGGMIEP